MPTPKRPTPTVDPLPAGLVATSRRGDRTATLTLTQADMQAAADAAAASSANGYGHTRSVDKAKQTLIDALTITIT